MTVPSFSAMLAGLADGLPKNSENFVVEEKFDGIRGLVVMDRHNDDKLVQVWNRHGENKGRLTNAPALKSEIEKLGDSIPDLWDGTVLDGELVANTWNDTMHLLGSAGRSGPNGLKFVVFDLPFLMGKDIRGNAWHERRELLETIFQVIDEKSMVQISALLPATQEQLDQIWARGGEGVIVKNKNAAYYPGDRSNWFKLKQVRTAEAFIMGYTPGNGKYIGKVGAVVLGQYKDGKPVKVTQVSGMTDEVRFALTESDVNKVIEFEYQDRTAGSYRHPRWLRWREDKKPTDCTWEATE